MFSLRSFPTWIKLLFAPNNPPSTICEGIIRIPIGLGLHELHRFMGKFEQCVK